MERMLLIQRQKAATYLKFLYTPADWGIGIALYLDTADRKLVGWEFTAHLFCFQMWLGG